MILASIVEKETGTEADRAKVASVFVNRLRIGMPLQTDPTVIYGLGERFDGNLRRRDLTTDGPYNTYLRPGLPPCPPRWVCALPRWSVTRSARPSPLTSERTARPGAGLVRIVHRRGWQTDIAHVDLFAGAGFDPEERRAAFGFDWLYDLLFVRPYKQTAHAESVIEYMLYALWDLGFKVGHASRTVEECLKPK